MPAATPQHTDPLAGSAEQRRYQRVRCHSEATLKVGTWWHRQSIPSTVRNASLGGVLLEIESGTEVADGQRATLEWVAPANLGIPEKRRRLKLSGQVVRTSSTASSQACAIKFSTIIPDHIKEREYWPVRLAFGLLAF